MHSTLSRYLRIELQRPVGGAEDVNAPVADQAAAEIVEAAPVEGQVEAEVSCASEAASARPPVRRLLRRERPRARRGRPLALRVTKARNRRRRRCTGRNAAPPSHTSQLSVSGTGVGGGILVIPCGQLGRASPGVDFLDFADFAGPEDLAGDAGGVMRVALVAHLGGDLVFLGGLVSRRASHDVRVSGFSTYTCLPAACAPGRRWRACGRPYR